MNDSSKWHKQWVCRMLINRRLYHHAGNLQKACGVANLKMSDYGFTPDEFDTLATNAKETMGGYSLPTLTN